MSRTCWPPSCARSASRSRREHPAGVGFDGPLEHAYLACLHSRTASRVLLTLGRGGRRYPDAMYAALLRAALGGPPRAGGHARRRHRRREPGLAATHAVRGAEGQGRDRRSLPRAHRRRGRRWTWRRPDLRVNLRFARERATIGIDLSGEPLHRRGYRQSRRRSAAQGKPGGGAAAALRLAGDRRAGRLPSSTRCAARARS